MLNYCEWSGSVTKLVVKSKVILDNGNEYVFEEHPADLLKRVYDKKTGKVKQGFLHGNGFSIAMKHIASIEDVDVKIKVEDTIATI